MIESEEMTKWIVANGGDPIASTPEEYAASGGGLGGPRGRRRWWPCGLEALLGMDVKIDRIILGCSIALICIKPWRTSCSQHSRGQRAL